MCGKCTSDDGTEWRKRAAAQQWWVSGNTSDTRTTVSRLCTKTNTELCLHWTLFQLSSGEIFVNEISDLFFLAFVIIWTIFYFSSIYRFRAVKSGKWNVRVCVAKSLANVRQRFHYFVPKLSPANGNSERYGPCHFHSLSLSLEDFSWNSFPIWQLLLLNCAYLNLISKGVDKSATGMHVPTMFWSWRNVDCTTGNSRLHRWRPLE